MIISENKVTVPGRKYKTKVSCVSTRRLTTIEWLLLNCTKKFSVAGGPSYLVKDVFEKVFQFQNSELLIRPCLRNLEDIRVIVVNEGNAYDYSSLRLSEIKLTELGQVMLKDGLLPGEQREIPIEIFYNPLTGKITTSDWRGSQENAIEFGTESDYDLEFPKDKIIEGLQTGAVASGKFTAAKFRIEDIENLVGSEWTFTTDISIDLDDKGEIHTIPDILEESVYGKVGELLKCKEISSKYLGELPLMNEIEISGISGSGSKIKQIIQDICNNSKVIFIHDKTYEAFKKNTSLFKNKIVIVFHAKKTFDVEVKREKKDIKRLVYIPKEFPIDGVIIMNEKGENLSLCRAEWGFKGRIIKAPVAVADRRMLPNNRLLEKWIEDIIVENMADNTAYTSLMCLPGIMTNKKNVYKSLANKWNDSNIETIINDVKKEKIVCDQLGVMPLDLSSLTAVWESKIDYDKPQDALQYFSAILSVELISKRSMLYGEIVGKIIDKLEEPQSYANVNAISNGLGMKRYEDILAIEDIEIKLFTKSVIEDILKIIVRGDRLAFPSRYIWEIFFLDYLNCLENIEVCINKPSLFDSIDEAELKKCVNECINIGSLQINLSEIMSKNAYIMDQAIDVYVVMKGENVERANAFFTNIDNLDRYLKEVIEAEDTSIMTSNSKNSKENKQKVYILDTCAMIHNPRIFLYFSEDEYVRIPTKVIDEIGKIKDHRSDKYSPETSSTARMIARDISENYLELFNEKNKARLLIENADTSLLPEDLDPTVPDNQILSVALKYPDCETIIISDDTVFQLTSLAQEIRTITGEEFIETHKEYQRSLEGWRNSVKTRHSVTGSINRKSKASVKKKEIATEVSMDDRSVRELMNYAAELTNPIMSLLNTNSINTIGQFKELTPERIDLLKAKGAQAVYKNTLKYVISRLDQILDKMEKDSDQNKEDI